MKLIYFKRKAKGFHIHGGAFAECFYIPQEEAVLFRERQGTFGSEDYSLNEETKFLEEVKKAIANPELFSDNTKEKHEGIPVTGGITYSNIKEFEYDDSKVQQLIQDAQSAKELEVKVQTGIESLLEQVR